MKRYKENISTLIVSKIKGTITESELIELNAWINTKTSNKELYEKLTSELWFEEKISAYCKIDTEKSIAEMKKEIGKRTRRIKMVRYTSVASVLIAIICSTFFLINNSNVVLPTQKEIALQKQVPVQQKTYRAILTLGDGTEVKIEGNETESNRNNAIIDSNRINYANAKEAKLTFNKLYVSRTENYSIILNDNTRVWLNSETELRYPTVFVGDKREVFLKGEAYFEVTKSEKPFIVNTLNSSIKVLGTSFNVSCYNDEPELTTLAEGSVELKNSKSNKLVVLKPGMQGKITNDNSYITVKNVNADIYSAWINGLINFENETLETIMKQIERWYDVKVIYDNDRLKNLHFYLKMSKLESISEFIRILEITKVVKCDINDNIIRIMPM